MKKIILLSFLSIFISTSLIATDYYYYRLRFEMHEVPVNGEKANYPVVAYSPDFMGADVITSIDGTSTRNLSEDAVYALFESKPSATFAIRRWNKELSKTIAGLSSSCHPSKVISEDELRVLYTNSQKVFFSGYEEYRDKNADFFKYKTYDIEFAESGCSAMDKKMFADNLIKELSTFGLERNTENPQMLFIVELFSGKKEQYVPPTTSISTQYKYGYDIFSGWGARQYITSQKNEGHTDVSYLYKVSVSVMDVAQLKQKPSVPPVIWSANCSDETDNKQTITGYAGQKFFSEAFLTFRPITVFICPIFTGTCQNLGVYFDGNNPSIIACVDPNGTGARAGLKAGNKILSYKDIYEVHSSNGSVGKNAVSFGEKFIPAQTISSFKDLRKLWRLSYSYDKNGKPLSEGLVPYYFYIKNGKYYRGDNGYENIKAIDIVFQDNGKKIKATNIELSIGYNPVYFIEN